MAEPGFGGGGGGTGFGLPKPGLIICGGGYDGSMAKLIIKA